MKRRPRRRDGAPKISHQVSLPVDDGLRLSAIAEQWGEEPAYIARLMIQSALPMFEAETSRRPLQNIAIEASQRPLTALNEQN